MSGTWVIEPQGEQTRLRLLHTYRAIDDDPQGLEWIEQAVDRNSKAELPSLKANVELATRTAELALSFVDSVTVDGAAKDVYDFINDAGRWTERLPHVASVALTEDTPGLQVLRMDTLTKDGSSHTTESVRVYLARDLTQIERPGEIVHEDADLRMVQVPLQDAVRAVLAGDIVNGAAVSGILATELVLRTGVTPRAETGWTDGPALEAQDRPDLRRDLRW